MTLATLATVRRSWDADAGAYIKAVEAADAQQLEPYIARAINQFVLGCKADGTWSAIKASCILMGARTLSGALTPLVGTAPTNVNFVSGDYSRKTGLKGNGSTKYLNSNRAGNADGATDNSMGAWCSEIGTSQNNGFIGFGAFDATGATQVIYQLQQGAQPERFLGRNRLSNAGDFGTVSMAFVPGLYGVSRSESLTFLYRAAANSGSFTYTASNATATNSFVFARNATGSELFSAARLSFYWIGSVVNLGLLSSRVSALRDAIGAAIP